MYIVNEGDAVRPLSRIPGFEPGAPIPVIVADEWHLFLAYIIRQPLPPEWDGTSIEEISHNRQGEPIAQIAFEKPLAHMFGPPNDEAIDGHPLSSRGLERYGAFEVQNSSWIRSLVAMNAVHPRHDESQFAEDRHFIFTFHDSTFECVASEFRVSLHVGSVQSAIAALTSEIT